MAEGASAPQEGEPLASLAQALEYRASPGEILLRVLRFVPTPFSICRRLTSLLRSLACCGRLQKPDEEEQEEDDYIEVIPSQRFKWDDPEMVRHLDEHGYVVVAGALTQAELDQAESLLWEFMQAEVGWLRTDPDTWTDESFRSIGLIEKGLVNRRGIGQSELSWLIRTRETVRGAFERIWDTAELLTSFDGINIFRPWHHGFMKTTGNWYHVDQGRTKHGRHAVQGLVSLFDQDGTTGGLVVVPGSLHRHDEVLKHAVDDTDFVAPPSDCPTLSSKKRLVVCKAGDLVLWDSRCLHCNTPAVETPTKSRDELLRACVYVCMTPKAWASEQVLQDRIKGYEIRATTSHWPHTNVMGFGWARPGLLSYAFACDDRRSLIG